MCETSVHDFLDPNSTAQKLVISFKRFVWLVVPVFTRLYVRIYKGKGKVVPVLK